MGVGVWIEHPGLPWSSYPLPATWVSFGTSLWGPGRHKSSPRGLCLFPDLLAGRGLSVGGGALGPEPPGDKGRGLDGQSCSAWKWGATLESAETQRIFHGGGRVGPAAWSHVFTHAVWHIHAPGIHMSKQMQAHVNLRAPEGQWPCPAGGPSWGGSTVASPPLSSWCGWGGGIAEILLGSMQGAQVAVGSHVSKSPLLLGCEGCSRVLRHEGTVPAGGLAGTGASSLEDTHADVDPDPGPWPELMKKSLPTLPLPTLWPCSPALGCSSLWVSPCPLPAFQSGADLATSGTGPCSRCVGGVGPLSRGICQVVTSHLAGPGRSECQVPAPGFRNKVPLSLGLCLRL